MYSTPASSVNETVIASGPLVVGTLMFWRPSAGAAHGRSVYASSRPTWVSISSGRGAATTGRQLPGQRLDLLLAADCRIATPGSALPA